MKQETLAKWLKTLIVGVGVGIILLMLIFSPLFDHNYYIHNLITTSFYKPVAITICIAIIPIYPVLVFSWKIASNIGKDAAFTLNNAIFLKWIAYILSVDVAFFFITNLALLLTTNSNTLIFIITLFVDFIGICLSTCASGLSYLTRKSAQLQDDVNLTI